MFSFHKPRVYRSASGCCICRAKSSSSRFTDSKRYEDVFFECFKLEEDRSGEICNACVLLVKRWKKLPQGSLRNWEHVVDARAGHGSKPLSKINKVKKNKLKTVKRQTKPSIRQEVDREVDFQLPLAVAEKIKKNIYIPQINRSLVSSPSGFSDDLYLDCLSSESCSSSLDTSPIPSPLNVDDENTPSVCISSSQRLIADRESGKVSNKRRRSKGLLPQKNRASMSSFLDLTFWKKEKTCCGIIFKGPFGEVLLDRRFFNPCYCRSNTNSSLPSTQFENLSSVSEKDSALKCFSMDSNYPDQFSNSAMDAFRMLTNVTAIPPNDNTKLMMSPYVSKYAQEVD